MSRLDDLNRFYQLLAQLEFMLGGRRLLADPDCKHCLPRRGVYFFFEPGEFRADRRTWRVVRVGTHGIADRTDSTLWSRLRQHRGKTRGRHAGGGNHRSSIFRLHVGRAILNRRWHEGITLQQWGSKHSPQEEAVKEAEHRLECLVSDHIRAMPYIWLAVDDPPSKESDRKVIEANAIALLSNLGRDPIDPPSENWLGRWSEHIAIRDSGLWNIDHVTGVYDAAFLALLEEYITKQASGADVR